MRTLEGVDGREVDEREDGVEGLAEWVMGEDGLMQDDTEAELVLRIEDNLFEEYVLNWEVEIDERVTELILAGLEVQLLSDCDTES